jgi:hypothetical protein
MTKAQEIKELDRMIKKLDPDSYLGWWLRESRATIVWAIENDLLATALTSGAK